MRVRLLGFCIMCTCALSTYGAEGIPQPLTLKLALDFASRPHPDLLLQQASLEYARAQRDVASRGNGLDVKMRAQARWVEPPESLLSLGRDDHRMVLQADRTVYDFGRTASQLDVSQSHVTAQEFYLQHVRLQRRYEIMSAFFDVILSDIRFNRENEDMAISFIRFDRIRDRRALGQYSDIDVLEAESDYQKVLRRRTESISQQRITRSRLAMNMNHPQSIPSVVVPPSLSLEKLKLPDVEWLQKKAHADNFKLKALRAKLAAAKAEVSAVTAEYWPQLNAELAIGAYSREIGSNDQWRAGLTLDVPIYKKGGIVAARKRAQLSQVAQLEAQILAYERELEQQVLSVAMRFNDLAVEIREKGVATDYRELYLDRARALYEMEVKTDLGDAMVQLTQASWERAKVGFEQALAWEKLRILTGGGLEELKP